MQLDHEVCYRAIKTRDARFDGQFFTAVRTTKIFCRPICPAPTPKSENCTFFAHAAAAQAAGYRPCLRCRPELAPDLASEIESSALVSHALDYIAAGALDEQSVEELAARLGVTERHLRRLFKIHLGASPITVAQNRRILFAKQLINDTNLSFADVALAAGFSSIRRFNDVMFQTYQRTPTQLRRNRTEEAVKPASSSITLRLPFSPPYNWAKLIQFLAGRAIPGVEVVGPEGSYYRRTIELDGIAGMIEVRPAPTGQNYLLATVYFPKIAFLSQIVERLRIFFDLSSNPTKIMDHFQDDPYLGQLSLSLEGLRVPGTWDRFELAVRAILGQQISVVAATTLAGRIAKTYGTPLVMPDLPETIVGELTHLFPSPQVLAEADLTKLGIIAARANTINGLARAVVANPNLLRDLHNTEEAVRQLQSLPGIGEWTAQYIAMRALHEPDAFPATDLGLLKSFSALAQIEPMASSKQLVKASQNWRPWRAYAAMYLWNMPLSVVPRSRKPKPIKAIMDIKDTKDTKDKTDERIAV